MDTIEITKTVLYMNVSLIQRLNNTERINVVQKPVVSLFGGVLNLVVK